EGQDGGIPLWETEHLLAGNRLPQPQAKIPLPVLQAIPTDYPNKMHTRTHPRGPRLAIRGEGHGTALALERSADRLAAHRVYESAYFDPTYDGSLIFLPDHRDMPPERQRAAVG